MQITAGYERGVFRKDEVAGNTRIRDLGANADPYPDLFLLILEEKKDDSRAAPNGAGRTSFS